LDPPLRDRYPDDIDREMVESIAQFKEDDGVASATVNRYLTVIKTILRVAWQEWDWMDKVSKIRMRKESGKRTRFLCLVDAERLFQELPSHLADMTRFAVATGLRMINIVKPK